MANSQSSPSHHPKERKKPTLKPPAKVKGRIAPHKKNIKFTKKDVDIYGNYDYNK